MTVTDERSHNGVVVIGGVPYRRSQFHAAPRVTPKDWALLALIGLGFVLSAGLAAAMVGLFAWGAIALLEAALRAIRS